MISNTENLKKCEKMKLKDSTISKAVDERRTKSILPERKISQFQAKKTIYLEALNKFYYQPPVFANQSQKTESVDDFESKFNSDSVDK